MKKTFFVFLHNAIAHPFLCTGLRVADRFHDWTGLIAYGPPPASWEAELARVKHYLLSDDGQRYGYRLTIEPSKRIRKVLPGSDLSMVQAAQFIARYIPLDETHPVREGNKQHPHYYYFALGVTPGDALRKLYDSFPQYRIHNK